jgi:RNA polymerase sigma-70 factor (ECF subfamily)
MPPEESQSLSRPGRRSASDEDLVRCFQIDPAGATGRAAAGELFERYQERVYLWCFRRVRNHEQALDLAQDALLAAYRNLPRFEHRSLYASWLFAIVRNRCFRVLRAPRFLDAEEGALEAVADERVAPDDAFAAREELERITRLMDEILDPEERLALWMRCEERLPVDEITRRLGVSTASGARGLLQTARRKLRAAIEGGGSPSRSPAENEERT